MKDPHVEILIYELKVPDNITYDHPPPIDIEYNEFSAHLESNQLICTMKAHYPSVETARKVIEEYLRAWEIDVALRLGRGELQFTYKDGKVIDRNPPPPGTHRVIHCEAGIHAITGLSTTMRLTRKQYPQPSRFFEISPDVEVLRKRYEIYLDGKEPICSMAYFCLTFIQEKFGGRPQASRMLSIDSKVLGKLGELSSKSGDALTARKATPARFSSPLSNREHKWIEAVVKVLIRRIGEHISGQELPKIKMADLPPVNRFYTRFTKKSQGQYSRA